MGYTYELEFEFSGDVANLTTGELHKIAAGKPATLTVKRGEANQIQLVVHASHTGLQGHNPDPDLNVSESAPQWLKDMGPNFPKGFPYATTHRYLWEVKVDDHGEMSADSPKNASIPHSEMRNVDTKVNPDYAKSNTKYLGINLEINFDGGHLGLDAPFVDGEGNFIKLEGDSFTSGKLDFGCRLVAEKQKENVLPAPKISRDLTETTVYFYKVDGDKLPPPSLDKIEKWVKEIKKIELLYEAFTVGMVPIIRVGNTSKSGRADYNEKLAKRRIKVVDEQLIKRFGSTKLDLPQPKPKGQSNSEQDSDYSVDISFSKEQAEASMQTLQEEKVAKS